MEAADFAGTHYRPELDVDYELSLEDGGLRLTIGLADDHP